MTREIVWLGTPLSPLKARPKEGWKERCYYEVEVSFRKGNPIHRAFFFSGFLNGPGGSPGGYNVAWSPFWGLYPYPAGSPNTYNGQHVTINSFYYFLPVRLISEAL